MRTRISTLWIFLAAMATALPALAQDKPAKGVITLAEVTIVGRSPDDFMSALAYGASGGFIFIYLLYTAQWIQVILAVEENTKQATYVLEKLTTLTQQVRDRLGDSMDHSTQETGDRLE